MNNMNNANIAILVTWIAIFLIMIGFLGIIGTKITKRITGVLIDEKNKFSLSRLQIIIWMLVILSAYSAACLYNMYFKNSNPMTIALPEEIWLLMGITTITLVGSPLVLNSKKEKPDKKERDKNKATLKEKNPNIDVTQLTNKNLVMFKKDPSAADITDLFRGDETGNFAQIDIGKIQLIFFTSILAIAYSASIFSLFTNVSGSITNFPEFDAGMTALLGISNAGLLGYKGTKHSRTEEEMA
jgi:hypothetical protein